MDLLKTKALNAAIEEYKIVEEEYKKQVNMFNQYAIDLYQQRKKAVSVLVAFRQFIESLQHNDEFIILLSQAESIEDFQNVMTKEETGEECHAFDVQSGNAAAGAGAAAGIGLATALGGQTALWALASTYGVASTGTAIGTLAGVAEWNAFMAWLGGGALTAGGGGVVLGTTIFGAIPVIGWIVAATGVILGSWKISRSRKKNTETLLQVRKATKQMRTQASRFFEWSNHARNINNHIVEEMAFLNVGLFVDFPTDCAELSKRQHDYLVECCRYYTKLCQDINLVVAK